MKPDIFKYLFVMYNSKLPGGDKLPGRRYKNQYGKCLASPRRTVVPDSRRQEDAVFSE